MQFITVNDWNAGNLVDYRSELESSRVLYFPTSPFALNEEDQSFLRGLDFAGGAIHKNVAYRPLMDRLTGINDAATSDRVRRIMREFSTKVVEFTARLLPEYARQWKLDYASFRPVEEENRNLPPKKRNDLIHTDAFPSRPTGGDLILRVFTNIHPVKTRNWVITDGFATVAKEYAEQADLKRIAKAAASPGRRLLNSSARVLKQFGVPVVPRAAYDQVMLQFHDYLKLNADFQASCPKYRFEFPPGSAWTTFTDLTPHSVHSGQHALEQTFIVSRHSLANEEKGPLAILERICGQELAPRA
jgi:hypothetical protein